MVWYVMVRYSAVHDRRAKAHSHKVEFLHVHVLTHHPITRNFKVTNDPLYGIQTLSKENLLPPFIKMNKNSDYLICFLACFLHYLTTDLGGFCHSYMNSKKESK